MEWLLLPLALAVYLGGYMYGRVSMRRAQQQRDSRAAKLLTAQPFKNRIVEPHFTTANALMAYVAGSRDLPEQLVYVDEHGARAAISRSDVENRKFTNLFTPQH